MSDENTSTMPDGLLAKDADLVRRNPLLKEAKATQMEMERDGDLILIKIPNPQGKGVMAFIIPIVAVPSFINSLQRLASDDDQESRRGYA